MYDERIAIEKAYLAKLETAFANWLKRQPAKFSDMEFENQCTWRRERGRIQDVLNCIANLEAKKARLEATKK